MKKLLTVGGLLLLSAMSYGFENRFDQNVRLQASWGPVSRNPHPIGVQFRNYLHITRNGDVVFYPAGPLVPTHGKTIASLNAYQMDRIERLIDEAKDGEISTLVPRCLAIATEQFTFEADQGRIALLDGSSPCGTTKRNVSPSAEKLVKLLQKYQNQANAELLLPRE